MAESIELRIHEPKPGPAGNRSQSAFPPVVYLPGTHGDWTLIGSFRRALDRRVRFVEATYPRTVTWSLEDYAEAIEAALVSAGIHEGWLLAESFGSQLAWPLLERKRFRSRGLILAGGFVRHPNSLGVRLAERIAGGIPLRWITRALFCYAKIARWRFRHSPEAMQDVANFLERRTEEDRRAAQHRLKLIGGNDPRPLASRVSVPVFAISGLWDPVVPWMPVRRWLKKHCPAFREFRVVRQADHNVLGTAPALSAEQVLRWIGTAS